MARGHILVILVLITAGMKLVECNSGFIGFDCTAKNINRTTISRTNVEECLPPKATVNTTNLNIQVLQLKEVGEITVKLCKVVILRTVYYCGAFSHLSPVIDGIASYILPMNRETCLQAHSSGILHIGKATIKNLKVHALVRDSVVLFGRVDSNTDCHWEGGDKKAVYEDVYNSWNGVLVQAAVEVTLDEYKAEVDLENNKVRLKSGKECEMSQKECLDIEGGYAFWDMVPSEDKCNSNLYAKVYQGSAVKIESKDETFYVVEYKTKTFTLSTVGIADMCYFHLLRTAHPKLFIIEDSKSVHDFFATSKALDVKNLDLFAYVNSKFVYVENHIGSEIKAMYEKIVMKRCQLERKILLNNLAIATINPDEFALRYTNSPGYTALVSGEVIHIMQCAPVNLYVRLVDKCYDKIPVNNSGELLFLNPITRILSSQSAEIPCNSIAAPYFQINGDWYAFLPNVTKVEPPITLKPSSTIDWHYKPLKNLMNNGLYSKVDLDNYNKFLRSNQHQSSVIMELTRIVNEHHKVTGTGFSFPNFLEKADLREMARDFWDSLWGKFTKFGNVVAGLLGIFLIIKAISSVLKAITEGVALHRLYGWSLRLMRGILRTLVGLAREEQQHGQEQQEQV